jgi:ribosomal protein S18 acetylase RimI-like enzyme
MNELMIREVRMQDLNEISRIHQASFDDRALSQLGSGAVKRYYRWLLTGFSEVFPICAQTEGGNLAGFCFMGVYAGSFSGFLNNNKWYLVGAVLKRPWLIANPLVRGQAKLAVRTLRRTVGMRKINQHTRPSARENSTIKYSSLGILSIAVDPAFQRRGVGELLMQRAEELACQNGYHQLHLSVHPDNLPAVKFYEKLGWEKLVGESDWTGKMIKRLSN